MMPKVEFKFDIERELHNLWWTCNSSSVWSDPRKEVSPKTYKMCHGKKFNECKKELEKSMKKFYSSDIINNFIGVLQKLWGGINDEYFKRLEKITKKKFSFDKVAAYITTSGRCPYDYKTPWFMVSVFYPIPYSLSTCGHELMHIHFHKTYWNKVEKQIGKEKTSDLKEALTVLLNLEFKDLWFAHDWGYEYHKELRAFIKKEWKKEKDFDKLITKCISYLKKK